MGAVLALTLCLALAAPGPTPCQAQTRAMAEPVAAPQQTDAAGTGFSLSGLPWAQIAVLVGGAYLGSSLARTLFDNRWFGLLGARLGQILGLDALAALGLAGEGAAAGTAPAIEAAPAALKPGQVWI